MSTCLVADILQKEKGPYHHNMNLLWKDGKFWIQEYVAFKAILTIISAKYTIPLKLNVLKYVTIMLMPLLLYYAQQH